MTDNLKQQTILGHLSEKEDKISKTVEYILYTPTNAKYTNLSEILHSLLLEEISFSIKLLRQGKYRNEEILLFSGKGTLSKTKDSTGIYKFSLENEIFDDLLWEHIGSLMEIKIKRFENEESMVDDE